MTPDPALMSNRRWRQVVRLAEQVLQADALQPVPSPCQSVCVMHPDTGWCEGCMRTLAEIAAWSRMDQDRQRAVWAQLPGRLVQRMALEDPQ